MMLTLSLQTVMGVLRALAQQNCDMRHTGMLPAAGTPERCLMARSVHHFFGLQDDRFLPSTAITLEEWASALCEHADIRSLQLFDAPASGAFSAHIQRTHRHWVSDLRQEASALHACLESSFSCQGLTSDRTLVSWLSLQTSSGFMLGALLPQQAGWKVRSLFDHANALWELTPGDIMVTSCERWSQLVERLPSLPIGITAVATAALDEQTYRALLAKGVTRIIELYCQPGLGVLATRDEYNAPFELLSHWHPTESDDFLLKLVANSAPQEIQLSEPLNWVGARHFTLPIQGDDEYLPAWQLPPINLSEGASAA